MLESVQKHLFSISEPTIQKFNGQLMQLMQETFILLWLKKQTRASAFLTIFWMIDRFLQNQYKPLKANNLKYFNEINFQITVFAVTAVVKQNYKLR